MSTESNYWQRAVPRRYTRRSLLRGTAIGLAGVAGASLLACRSTNTPLTAPGGAAGSATGQPQSGDVFNNYVAANLSGLDPMVGSSASAGIVNNSAYVGLFRFKTSTDPRTTLNLEPESNLATSIESPDGLTWTVKLRTDTVFHNIAPVNGHPITSEDVKASFQRSFATPNNTSISLINMIDPTQISTPAVDTVVFKLRSVFGPFHLTLAGAGASGSIMPREALAGSFDPGKTVIGSGPLMWDSYAPDIAINLKRHPGWFEKGQPYVDGVKVAIIPDPAQQLAQFTAGHIDSVRPTPKDLPTVQQNNPKAAVFGVPSSRSWVYFGHMDRPNTAFYDVNVRRAMSMAMDRATMAKAIFGSDFSNNGVIPAALGTSALTADQLGDASQWYKFNPEEARKLIAATPAIKQIRRFLYPTPTYGAQFETLCTTAVSMLNAVGLQIQAVPIDYNKDFINGGKGALYGNYPDDAVLASTQGVHNDAGSTLLYNYQSNNDHNLPKVSDKQIDAMMDKMNTTLDESAHLMAVLDIQRAAAAQVYFIPLPSEYAYTAVQPWVYNYQYSSSGNVSEGPNTLSRLWLKRS
ncbi:MAG TPA: ABC transporter substrate-binding protein [Dehalococcoidia bacterium]|nr:ABC transporter substrate-binding protein [Dehalococcoidia bacterium]